MPLLPGERKRFDTLLERVLGELPPALHEMMEEVPLVVDDEPSRRLLEEMGDEGDLLGLHSGVPLTERGAGSDHGEVETIHLFRRGIIEEAGGWSAGEEAVEREIRITLLHEIGHHFGLDESDLERLGYA